MNALDTKIEEISIDAKQAEQISTLFDIGFEMGFVFSKSGNERTSPDYHKLRKLYVEAASPVMVQMFDEIMKEYEKQKS